VLLLAQTRKGEGRREGPALGRLRSCRPKRKDEVGESRSGFWCCYWAGAPDGSRRLGHLGPIDQEGNKGTGRLAGQVLDASHAGGVPCSVLYGLKATRAGAVRRLGQSVQGRCVVVPGDPAGALCGLGSGRSPQEAAGRVAVTAALALR
jgi:hypothetical protein